MERLCYLSKNYPSTDGSGNKAKTDNEDTLALMGAVNIANKRTGHRNKIAAFFVDLAGIARYVCSVRKGDRIVLQYPHKKYFSFICRIARWRGAKTITLIHDLGSFRRKRLTVEKEIRRLMNTDYVIASNEVMRQWLIDYGFRKPTGSLGLFDYRSNNESKEKRNEEGTVRIVYAGALSIRKNAFMLEMAKSTLPYQLHVFGNRDGLPQMQDNPQVIFHGFLPADDFISNVDADFGLVWDGDSTESCTGNFGEYLRYNSPHKVSFYLRAGLPIIVWRQAAVAPIIEREDVGFCIDSIEQLQELLPSLKRERIETMRRNVRELSNRLKNGAFLKAAVESAISELQ
ncbi:MAG: galactofuranosyltransferase [Prevotella sp.]|nr:galactofuranosyltransferase [Prevotella sp.]MBR6139721.1 galactofuranosyltransferase [Prevotella sp.]